MRINVRKFFITFGLLQVAMFLAGCSAAWLGAVSGLLPALEAAVSAVISLVMALEGKTVPASVSAAIQKIGADVQAEIANVQQLIAAFKANASTGLLSQIQAVFQGIVSNLGNILAAANVTDSSTIAKVTSLVGLAVAAAQAIIALIPLAIHKMSSGASSHELEAYDKVAAVSVNNTHKGLQEAYHVVVTEPTENADVNTALAALPQTLP
jgi:hypothetical protein